MQVRMRDTFMKVAQSLIVKKQLVNEKSIKEKMIHSVMPPKVTHFIILRFAQFVQLLLNFGQNVHTKATEKCVHYNYWFTCIILGLSCANRLYVYDCFLP
jgi:hypothetical protein